MFDSMITNHMSLESDDYDSEAIFRAERKMLFNRLPIFAGTTVELKKAGDYIVSDIGPDSVIVARTKEGNVSAVANTCRHRGTRLISKESVEKCRNGRLTSYTCPYHAWRYDLDGQLIAARGLEQTEPTLRAMNLRRFTTQEVAGLIFYHGNPGPIPELEELQRRLGPFQLKDAKAAANTTFVVNANWKIWIENFLECWHCEPNHPEMTSVVSYVKAVEHRQFQKMWDRDAEWRKEAAEKGFDILDDIDFHLTDNSFTFHLSTGYENGAKTASKGGLRLGPTLGITEGFEGGHYVGCIGPFFYYFAFADYVVLVSVEPKSTKETHLHLTWMVAPDFDGDIDELTWFWKTTIPQDLGLVAETQSGVESSYYTPGNYVWMEEQSGMFSSWWTDWKNKHIA